MIRKGMFNIAQGENGSHVRILELNSLLQKITLIFFVADGDVCSNARMYETFKTYEPAIKTLRKV